MHGIGKLLQILGLSIPPLSIMAQLANSISQGQMLMFLVASACAFDTNSSLTRSCSADLLAASA